MSFTLKDVIEAELVKRCFILRFTPKTLQKVTRLVLGCVYTVLQDCSKRRPEDVSEDLEYTYIQVHDWLSEINQLLGEPKMKEKELRSLYKDVTQRYASSPKMAAFLLRIPSLVSEDEYVHLMLEKGV